MLEHLQRTSETWLLKWSKVNYHFQIELKINCGLSLHVIKNNLRNLWNEMLTWHINYFVDELQKLVDIGYGKLVSKEKMKRDKILPSNQCSNVYMKPWILGHSDILGSKLFYNGHGFWVEKCDLCCQFS